MMSKEGIIIASNDCLFVGILSWLGRIVNEWPTMGIPTQASGSTKIEAVRWGRKIDIPDSCDHTAGHYWHTGKAKG